MSFFFLKAILTEKETAKDECLFKRIKLLRGYDIKAKGIKSLIYNESHF